MLIGFTGAGGCGKTTTAKALSEATGVPFLASSSRPIFEAWKLKSERDQLNMPVEDQWRLQCDIFDARQRLELRFRHEPNFICDRTLLDQACYSMLRTHGVIDQERYNTMMLAVAQSMTQYDYVFYFPLVNYPTKEDGMRDTIIGSRIVFDALLMRILSQRPKLWFAVPAIKFGGRPDEFLTVDDRVTFIRGIIIV